jgi:hypothetical protein
MQHPFFDHVIDLCGGALGKLVEKAEARWQMLFDFVTPKVIVGTSRRQFAEFCVVKNRASCAAQLCQPRARC